MFGNRRARANAPWRPRTCAAILQLLDDESFTGPSRRDFRDPLAQTHRTGCGRPTACAASLVVRMFLSEPCKRSFIDETLRLMIDALDAHRVAFYGVDRNSNLRDFVVQGVPHAFHEEYLNRMVEFDPLHIRRVAGHTGPLVRWDEAAHYASPEHVSIYARFLSRYGVVDSLELLFRDRSTIVAGLNVAWTERDPPPSAKVLQLAAQLQRYVEFSLAERLRAARSSWVDAARAYGLTSRECEVAQLVCKGRTNHAVAVCLGIAESTVKTHLVRIFDKCRVDSRAGLVACLTDRGY